MVAGFKRARDNRPERRQTSGSPLSRKIEAFAPERRMMLSG
jgi:hypothetical protein